MLSALRLLFVFVLVSMIGVTTWAGLRCPLFAVPRDVATHPWFIATLFDAYWGFATFYVWVACKQTAWPARVAWFVAIMLLGNIAMSAYCLRELGRVSATTPLADVLTRRDAAIGVLGPLLAALGIAVVVLGAL